MSVERIRLLLRQETTSAPTTIDRRQQISPEINFTCDGMITKWIIVANSLTYTNSFFFPELQVWRNIGNDVYHKISGTHIFLPFVPQSTNTLFEYSSFDPIPVRAGDVLGVFIPDDAYSRILLRSEVSRNRPRQHYHTTYSDIAESPFNIIDIMNNETQRATISSYYPLVTVQFGKHISMMINFMNNLFLYSENSNQQSINGGML